MRMDEELSLYDEQGARGGITLKAASSSAAAVLDALDES